MSETASSEDGREDYLIPVFPSMKPPPPRIILSAEQGGMTPLHFLHTTRLLAHPAHPEKFASPPSYFSASTEADRKPTWRKNFVDEDGLGEEDDDIRRRIGTKGKRNGIDRKDGQEQAQEDDVADVATSTSSSSPHLPNSRPVPIPTSPSDPYDGGYYGILPGNGPGFPSPTSFHGRFHRQRNFFGIRGNQHGGLGGNSNSSSIMCANCGCIGHVYRACNLPTTSFGVICFRWTVNVKTGVREPQYLMVQRKDSLCFVEFVRGKFDLRNREYITQLLESMTRAERERLRACSFHDLWFGFWQTDSNRGYAKEYHLANDKFETLRRGYYLRRGDGTVVVSRTDQGGSTSESAGGYREHQVSRPEERLGPLEFVSLDCLLSCTGYCENDEPEWGFPKGRRNINEKDIKCAVREFREETGINMHSVHVHSCMKPFEEIFTGCNNVRYRHVYYLVQLRQQCDAEVNTTVEDLLLNGGRCQLREVSRVAWLCFSDAMSRIRSRNVERKEVFKKVHAVVTNSLRHTRAGWPAPLCSAVASRHNEEKQEHDQRGDEGVYALPGGGTATEGKSESESKQTAQGFAAPSYKRVVSFGVTQSPFDNGDTVP